MYVHYWHFNKNWYAKLNDNPDSEKVYPLSKDNYIIYECWKNYLIPESSFLTRHQIIDKLKEMYPHYILIKDKLFHEGRRWFGNKRGSRNR